MINALVYASFMLSITAVTISIIGVIVGIRLKIKRKERFNAPFQHVKTTPSYPTSLKELKPL